VSRKRLPRASPTRKRQQACVELDALLSIAQAANLQRTLLAHLAKGGPVVIDGARVEEIDTAMLQLLASLWRTSGERGIDCTWKGASAALRQTAALVGVAEVLNFPAGEAE
jgi:anti-anti-sigma regulatory factor